MEKNCKDKKEWLNMFRIKIEVNFELYLKMYCFWCV